MALIDLIVDQTGVGHHQLVVIDDLEASARIFGKRKGDDAGFLGVKGSENTENCAIRSIFR